MTVGFNFAPRGWATCEGQLLPISQNTALFSLLGTTYGGDGRATFGLPDLRGRVVRGQGFGPGISNVSWGQRGGAESRVLSPGQLPSHTHSFAPRASSGDADGDDPSGAFPASGDFYNGTGDITMAASNTSAVGANQSFSILNPFLGMYVCIALVGIFPSRN